MADTNDTIADIIAEMRGMGNYQRYSGDHARVLANRLEAAHRRERGDCAKLREALEAIISGYENADLCDMNYGEWCHEPANPCVNVSLCKAIHESRVALAARPRNCDKYATADEALKAQEQMFNDSNFANGECKLGCPECDNPRVGCKIAWLFAPATEKEGGAK